MLCRQVWVDQRNPYMCTIAGAWAFYTEWDSPLSANGNKCQHIVLISMSAILVIKSAHRKEHLLSEVTTYRPITSHPFSSLPSRCRYMSWLVNVAKLRLGHSAHLCFSYRIFLCAIRWCRQVDNHPFCGFVEPSSCKYIISSLEKLRNNAIFSSRESLIGGYIMEENAVLSSAHLMVEYTIPCCESIDFSSSFRQAEHCI